MPHNIQLLRLLIIDDARNLAEQLGNLLRNAGYATRVQRITQSSQLEQALLQSDWELILMGPVDLGQPAASVIGRIGQQQPETPLICLSAEHNPQAQLEALQAGARDALAATDTQRLLLVVRRELAALGERRTRHRLEESLAEARIRNQLLLETSREAIAYIHEGMHVHANRSYLNLFGYSPQDLEGTPLIDLVALEDRASLRPGLAQPADSELQLACSLIKASGERFPADLQFLPAFYDSEVCTQLLVRSRLAETGTGPEPAHAGAPLPMSLQSTPSGHIAFASHLLQVASQHTRLSLALLRIDQFASLRAETGLDGAEQLIHALEAFLQPLLDCCHTERLGDDLLGLWQADTTPMALENRLNPLLEATRSHLFEIAGCTLQMTLSIGISGWSQGIGTPDDSLNQAYRSCLQTGPGNAILRYDPSRELAEKARQGDIQAVVRQALDNQAFRLLFQPVIGLRTSDSHEHYEVLLRLINPKGEEVSPNEFLEVASRAGMITAIDRWVIQNALRQLEEQQLDHRRPTRLFVHLSRASLQDASLTDWLQAQLQQARLADPSALILQINEFDAIPCLKQAQALFQQLLAMGCQLALSRFGDCENPFVTLEHLPAAFVKLDGSRVRAAGSPEGRKALLQMLETLHAMGKRSIVPYVESASILTTLWQAGVNYVQGYYLQGPARSMNYDFTGRDQ